MTKASVNSVENLSVDLTGPKAASETLPISLASPSYRVVVGAMVVGADLEAGRRSQWLRVLPLFGRPLDLA
ncbi:hypothetical protein OG21DRAFT_1487382 [Imleria badia]|nr:hypothetical protein OG21DRAFT_1487382 [Imleria badia]